MRIVVDANVLVSAYAHRGAVHEHWRDGLGPHEYVISPEIFQEVERNLRQSEFLLTESQVREALVDILNRCRLERTASEFEGDVPHEKDRHLVSLYVACAANYIVTGETVLLNGSNGGVNFISITDFIRDVDHSQL